MTRNTIVKPSPIHRKGLFACRSFRRGEIVEPIEGEIVLRISKSKYAMLIPGRRSLILTNKTKYVNSSTTPNVLFHLPRGLVAIKDIAVNEELTSEYAGIFD